MRISQKQQRMNRIEELERYVKVLSEENKELKEQNESYIAWRLQIHSEARKKAAMPDNGKRWQKEYDEQGNCL